ncbi:MAG: hypothetical protein R3F14_17535 [Polyangiaceae bacterium]
MSHKAYRFAVLERHLDGFVTALLLSTLEAMRSGFWPLDAGIWPLAQPSFRKPLEQAGLCGDITAILRETDELAALAELAGRSSADARLDDMIGTLRARLASGKAEPWEATIDES